MLTLLALLAAWGVSGCSDSSEPGDPGGDSLVIGTYSLGLYSTTLFVARDMGFFEKHGVEVEFRQCDTGAAAVKELLAGTVDLACCSEYVVASDSLKHPELRTVVELLSSTNANKLIARPDRGIDDISDLAGKRVGAVEGTSSHYYLEQSLALNGISPSDVDIVFLAASHVVEAMERGEVDAVIIWDPLAREITDQLGDNAGVWGGQGGQRFYFLLSGTEHSIEAKPGAVERVVAALRDAEQYCYEEPAKALMLVAEATQQSPETLGAGWDEFRVGILLSEGLRAALQSEIDWLWSRGGSTADPPVNALDLIDFAILETLAPEAISVIR